MSIMRVARADGHVLTYNTDDVEDFKVDARCDAVSMGMRADGTHMRVPGKERLSLHVEFKPGKRPLWVEEDALPPEIRAFLAMLEPAMREEGLDGRTIARVVNRLMAGHPDAQAHQFPAGQTPGERAGALIKAAGFKLNEQEDSHAER